jgi:hypothetical protein
VTRLRRNLVALQQSYDPFIPPLLVASPLRQTVAFVVAGYVGVEVRRVVGQQPACDQLLFLPQAEQPQLRLFQFIPLARGQGLAGSNGVKTIPEGLRGKPFRSKSPQ